MRVLIVDDHPIFRLGVGQLVAREWPEAVVAEAGMLEEGLRLASGGGFDAIVLDLVMPDVSGHEGVVRMVDAAAGVPILVLSFAEESRAAARLLQLGASGYLQKDRAGDELVTALKRLASGKRYVTETMADHLVDLLGGRASATPPHETLSAQEHRVMILLAAGRTPASIGQELAISARTVGTYRTRIFEKTGWKSNVELAKYCLQHGLVEPG